MAANFIEEFIVNFTLKHFCTVISFCLEDYYYFYSVRLSVCHFVHCIKLLILIKCHLTCNLMYFSCVSKIKLTLPARMSCFTVGE